MSLEQVGQLVEGVTAEELRGMLALRRAQLQQELAQQADLLVQIEARLRHIEKEGTMPADDIVSKSLPELPVVAIGGRAAAYVESDSEAVTPGG
jgi:hypothetical protein